MGWALFIPLCERRNTEIEKKSLTSKLAQITSEALIKPRGLNFRICAVYQ